MKMWRCPRGLSERTGGIEGDFLAESRAAAMETFDCDPQNAGCDCYGCEGPLAVSSHGRVKHSEVEVLPESMVPAPVEGAARECGIVPASSAVALMGEGGRDDDVIDTEFSEGQQPLGGDDVFPPSYEEVMSASPSVTEAQRKLLFVREQMQAADRAIKDIKKDAVAPFQGEITENQRRKDMLAIAFDFYVVQSALEEARVKSLHEDPIFCAYIAATEKKFLKVKVGTRQDMREAAAKYGDANVYVFGEYQEGRDVNAPAEGESAREGRPPDERASGGSEEGAA
ncbi:hypothetical protein [Cloacibacillus evryensis]|uniref:hypothetical protein n=1 Tax=Cloacibacillus evryensis TaxID=508460 RepID=UPI00241F6879|nr:hypothetical protein [Cloacibacillus evryensis]